MSSPANYLLRLRAERAERERRAQAAANQLQKLRDDKQNREQQESAREELRHRALADVAARRNSEQRQTASLEQQRRGAVQRIVEQRRAENKDETKERARREEQLRTLRAQKPARFPVEEEKAARAMPVAGRDPRLEALREVRAGQERKQQQEKLLRERVMEEQRERRDAAEAQARRRAELHLAAREQRLTDKSQAQAADEKAQSLRQRALNERAVIPAARLTRVPRPVPRATASRPSSSPTPAIPENQPLSWLSTQGAFIVDENNNAIYLRGVTVEGFDTVNPGPQQTLPDALGLDDSNWSTLEDLWGVNLIRIPFSAQSILHGNSALSADDLVFGLDDVIAEASAAGCYVLLALRHASGNIGLPSDDDYRAWKGLATRYQDEPAVLYEIFATDSALPQNWLAIAQAVIGTIRREHTTSLLFIGNGSGGASVHGLPLKFIEGDAIQNLAYTIRLSPQTLNAVNRPELQEVSRHYPLFVSEWSDGRVDPGRSAELAADLIQRYAIGWAGSSWNAEPRIVVNAGAHQFSPTRWGLVVQRSLARPVRPMLVAFS